jgi:hypothetical protein
MGLDYVENFRTININEGLIKTAMKIDRSRSLLDTSTCQTFTEVIVTLPCRSTVGEVLIR